jgi:hypothetical protein
MRLLRLVALPALLAVIVAGTAYAQITDRFVVASDADSAHYPKSLVVGLQSPPEYDRKELGVGGRNGSWKGPRYQASRNASLGADSSIDWSVVVERAANERDAFLGNRAQTWPVVEEGREPIERRVAGHDVGTLDVLWQLTKAPPLAGEARYEAGVSIPICGLWAVVRFAAMQPSGDSAGGNIGYGEYYVKGSIKPTIWNRDQVLTAIKGVSLEGSLLAARVTARGAGRQVRGTATDCNQHAVAGVRATLERRVGKRWVRAGGATTNDAGAFALRARTPGVYRVAVGTRRSAPVRVR